MERETELTGGGKIQSYSGHTPFPTMGDGDREGHRGGGAEEILTGQKLEKEWNKRY